MKFWENPAFQVFFSLLAYAIPSLLDLGRIIQICPALQIILFFIAVGAATYLSLRSLRRVYVRSEKILELMIKSIFPEKVLPKIRANIMLFERGKLRIKYAYNMLGMPDRYLELSPDQGCAGVAFRSGRPYSVDLTKDPHEKYKVPSDKVWKEMKSIVSFPIRRVTNKREVIGVLNVDSSLSMEEIDLLNERVRLILGGYAEILGEML